jgi:hypothetical protein
VQSTPFKITPDRFGLLPLFGVVFVPIPTPFCFSGLSLLPIKAIKIGRHQKNHGGKTNQSKPMEK